MSLKVEHEIHHRRFGRNLGVGLLLVAFAAVVFGLTIAKVSGGGSIEAFDHSYRSSILPPEADE
jgi:hypothetical protein